MLAHSRAKFCQPTNQTHQLTAFAKLNPPVDKKCPANGARKDGKIGDIVRRLSDFAVSIFSSSLSGYLRIVLTFFRAPSTHQDMMKWRRRSKMCTPALYLIFIRRSNLVIYFFLFPRFTFTL
jgi:hypothetical protein